MPYGYPPEFRHRVLGPIAAALGVSDQTIYVWRRQELIDTGVEPSLSSVEAAGLRAAKRRIVAFETESAVTRTGERHPCLDESRTAERLAATRWCRLLVGVDRMEHRPESLAPLAGPVARRRLIVFRSDSGDVALSGHTQTPQEPHTPPRNDAK